MEASFLAFKELAFLYWGFIEYAPCSTLHIEFGFGQGRVLRDLGAL
jgi:hypothetical protein